MASNHIHPRRRPHNASSPRVTPSLDTHHPGLRKSGTFHSPTSGTSDLCNPVDDIVFAPKRSNTCREDLEQLLNEPGADRVASFLTKFDKTFSGHASASASILNDPDVLPLPVFMLEQASMSHDPMEVDEKTAIVDHRHASDSGLGSSVGSKPDRGARRSSSQRSVRSAITTTRSAITKSHSAHEPAQANPVPGLSPHAEEQIKKRIILPILRQPALQDFHDLIKDVPLSIGQKKITNLRDLEKTLIFLAPEYSSTSLLYLNFCETTIRCIQTTVGFLSESEQRLPTDRPYTTNYFLDLVEQIRRYAAIMAATRKKEAAGEQLDEMDYSPDEKLTLRGGLGHNGKPAELVREKNGRVIPIADQSELVGPYTSTKRAHVDDDVDDDAAHRSMARRRKGEKPGDVIHVCRDCKKEFKRPCDLTKHEKTHSRPWKCPDLKCKYHTHGWPTEKERERHVNDKHSTAPPQFKCLYPPCTYASKRESNCKQHMEKAHGWEYVRSKSNGKRKVSSSTSTNRTSTTPLTPAIPTPASISVNSFTPQTPFAPSPSVPLFGEFEAGPFGYTPAMSASGFSNTNRRESVTTAGTAMSYSSSHSPIQPPTNSFEDAMANDPPFNHSLGFDANSNFSFNPAPVLQQPTPLSTGQDFFADFAVSNDFTSHFNLDVFNAATTVDASIPHLSPGAQADVTLFSPQLNDNMQFDEGFDEAALGGNFIPQRDFQLFDNNSNSGSTANDLFQDLHVVSNVGGQFEAGYHASMDDNYDDILASLTGQH